MTDTPESQENAAEVHDLSEERRRPRRFHFVLLPKDDPQAAYEAVRRTIDEVGRQGGEIPP